MIRVVVFSAQVDLLVFLLCGPGRPLTLAVIRSFASFATQVPPFLYLLFLLILGAFWYQLDYFCFCGPGCSLVLHVFQVFFSVVCTLTGDLD